MIDILATALLLTGACKAIEVVAKALDRAAGREVERHVAAALDETREVVSLDDLWDEHCATPLDMTFRDMPTVQRVIDLIAANEARRIDDEWERLA